MSGKLSTKTYNLGNLRDFGGIRPKTYNINSQHRASSPLNAVWARHYKLNRDVDRHVRQLLQSLLPRRLWPLRCLPFSRWDALRLQLLPTPASSGRRHPRRTSSRRTSLGWRKRRWRKAKGSSRSAASGTRRRETSGTAWSGEAVKVPEEVSAVGECKGGSGEGVWYEVRRCYMCLICFPFIHEGGRIFSYSWRNFSCYQEKS